MSIRDRVGPSGYPRVLHWLRWLPIFLVLAHSLPADEPLVFGPIRRVALKSSEGAPQLPRPMRLNPGESSAPTSPSITSVASSVAQPVGSSLTPEAVPASAGPQAGNSPVAGMAPQIQPMLDPMQVNPGLAVGGAAVGQPLVLDGRKVGCLSAEKWIPADLLRSRACTILRIYGDQKDETAREAAAAMARFLNIQAGHQEDIGAASALRAYYTRIALAEKFVLTLNSRQLLNEHESAQKALQEKGLAAVTDLSRFDRLRLQIQDDQLLITTQDRRLQSVLAQLTGMDYQMSSILQEQLEVYRCGLDCSRLQQIALQQRKDLRSWIYLSQRVNESTAPQFAKMLPTLIGGYALPMPDICGWRKFLCSPDYSQLASDMCREIQLTVETHRRWIQQAVLEKCSNVLLGYDRIDLAQQMIASWSSRIEQLEELESRGISRPEEMAEAETELLKARLEEIDRRLETRNAEIDLAEAVGCISDRCCSGQPWLLTGLE